MELLKKLFNEKPQCRDKLMDINDDAWAGLMNADKAYYNELKDELEDMMYCIDWDEAEKIVRAMKPYGQYWSKQDIETFLKGKGVTEHICDWYLVMNMARNDYYNTARMVGKQDDAEFYYSIARDFIMDPDGGKHKIGKYFRG